MNQKLHKEYPGLEVCGLGYEGWLEAELIKARARQTPLPFSEPRGNPPDADQPPDHPYPTALQTQAQAGVEDAKNVADVIKDMDETLNNYLFTGNIRNRIAQWRNILALSDPAWPSPVPASVGGEGRAVETWECGDCAVVDNGGIKCKFIALNPDVLTPVSCPYGKIGEDAIWTKMGSVPAAPVDPNSVEAFNLSVPGANNGKSFTTPAPVDDKLKFKPIKMTDMDKKVMTRTASVHAPDEPAPVGAGEPNCLGCVELNKNMAHRWNCHLCKRNYYDDLYNNGTGKAVDAGKGKEV